MTVAVIGLGLIGGSLAKAIKARTNHKVLGLDRSESTVRLALEEGAIDAELAPGGEEIGECELVAVALYPKAAVAWIEENAARLRPGSTLVDLCGVKRYVVDRVQPLFQNSTVTFIGGHPMAGMEAWGYKVAKDSLFEGASMILTPHPDTPQDKLTAVCDFFKSVGCGGITLTTPEHHDEVIAYTSQLAHVASSAYILSPAAMQNRGFSAGSYKDLTRVAKLNESMWTELFLCNGDYLCEEIDRLVENLQELRERIRAGDEAGLREMLAKGSERKQALG